MRFLAILSVVVLVVLTLILKFFNLAALMALPLFILWMLLVPVAIYGVWMAINGMTSGVVLTIVCVALFWFVGTNGDAVINWLGGTDTGGSRVLSTCNKGFCP